MVLNALSLHHNYTSAAHMQINAFIIWDASSVLEDVLNVVVLFLFFFFVFHSRSFARPPKYFYLLKPTSLNGFQVKDTYCGNSLPGPRCCTFPRTIYIIHCLRPESGDLYKERADRQRENRWCFISCRERERKRESVRWREYRVQYVFCLLFVGEKKKKKTFGAEVII